MVSPKTCLESVARAVASSGNLPNDMGVVMQEADPQSENADIDLPALEFQIDEMDDIIVHNTDFVGYSTDANGNHIGRLYESEYEMTIQIDIWTTPNDGYDPDELGEQLRNALYPYSSYGPDKPFLDDVSDPIEEVTYFTLNSGERTDDLIRTPSVRKWSQEVELWAYEEFSTEEEYILSVDYPTPSDIDDFDEDGIIENN